MPLSPSHHVQQCPYPMITKAAVEALIPQIVSPDEAIRHAALRALYTGDEQTAVILCDLFAAGLNEAQGCAVLAVVGEIGGFDAMMLLISTFYFDPRPAIKQAAALAMQRNSAALTAEERADLETFLAE